MPRKATLAKLIAHLKSWNRHCRWRLTVFMVLGLPCLCFAQDLVPRRWSHLPIKTNFLGGGYAYSSADIAFDPVLRLENVTMEMHTWAFQYIRTFELLHKSARIDFDQSYQEGRWSGLLDGEPASTERSGFSDSILRFAVNLYGAPPLAGKEFAAYRAKVNVETIVGTALVVQIPTGNYMSAKLINLGQNRFTFRPQLGVVHNRGKWSLELTGAVWLHTDNDDFFNGNKLEQDPFYTIQTHLVYNFHPGLWASAGFGYGYGGQTTLNGEKKDDRKENIAWEFSFGYPIAPWLGVKVAYQGIRTQTSVGQDTNNFIAGFSAFW